MNETLPVADSLRKVRDRLDRAALSAGRDPREITLIAVSKTQSAAAVAQVIDAGQRAFGENRVFEAAAKFPSLRSSYADLELHLIGPLQTNKVRDAISHFDTIHTVDRSKVAAEISKEIARSGRTPRLFVQVNTGAEPQKAGILPEAADAFLAECREMHRLSIDGVMCIPPVDEPAAPHFALLREIARRNGLAGLSMGMSGDFETAVALGATHVRVGSAIFGKRA